MKRQRSKTERNKRLCLDLFSGAGGFSEGFRLGGFHTLAATDIDPSAGGTYQANHSRYDTKFVLGDIASREVQEQLFDAVRGVELDAIIGGPPCQAFSQVRNHDRLINDPRNRLYRHYVSILRELKPRTFVMENVPGLQNLDGGAIRNQILKDLSLNGAYKVVSRVVDAACFGVPQNRQRVLFVGVRADLGIEPRFPQTQLSLPTLERQLKRGSSTDYVYRHSKDAEDRKILDILLDPEDARLVTVEQAIGDLAWLKPSDKLVRRPSDQSIEYETLAETAYQRARRIGSIELYNADVPSIREDTTIRLNSIPQGGNFRDLPKRLSARYLSGKKWGPELGRHNLSRKYFFAYRKLHPDCFSWTLNTKADCVFHYGKPRALTVREFARLHSFDDTYHFLAGDRHSRYRQIGNAVPPLFAKAIAKVLASILADYEENKSALRIAAE
jgi:DNA (cytosine-5)-methyltransferase 1